MDNLFGNAKFVTTKDIYNQINNEDVVTRDVTDELLRWDVMSSSTTQAALNDILVELNRRVKSNKKVVIEAIGDKVATESDLNSWIENYFTSYSYNMYKDSLV